VFAALGGHVGQVDHAQRVLAMKEVEDVQCVAAALGGGMGTRGAEARGLEQEDTRFALAALEPQWYDARGMPVRYTSSAAKISSTWRPMPSLIAATTDAVAPSAWA
jgi:hypothetical protein